MTYNTIMTENEKILILFQTRYIIYETHTCAFINIDSPIVHYIVDIDANENNEGRVPNIGWWEDFEGLNNDYDSGYRPYHEYCCSICLRNHEGGFTFHIRQ